MVCEKQNKPSDPSSVWADVNASLAPHPISAVDRAKVNICVLTAQRSKLKFIKLCREQHHSTIQLFPMVYLPPDFVNSSSADRQTVTPAVEMTFDPTQPAGRDGDMYKCILNYHTV